MTRYLTLPLTFLVAALPGCGDDSSVLPVDGRDFDGVSYSTGTSYSGRVIDGYLRNARVWLDMDGDGQYTPGPMALTLESGTEVVIVTGEPTTVTGAGGRFKLDVSDLLRDPTEAPDLDPRDYPLHAFALPGQTREELAGGEVVLERGFLLSAPPGVTNVTPLTTLARQRNLMGVPQLGAGDAALADAMANINVLGDYVQAGDQRAHAYARAFARYLANQFPDSANTVLAGGDGRENVLTPDEVFLLGASLATNAVEIIGIVDEAAPSGRYENVDIAALDLPGVAPDLSNPVLLTGVMIEASSQGGDLPASRTNLLPSTELTFKYQQDGRLLSVTANGCMQPSMQEIARLANADGRIAATGIQWLPTVTLSEVAPTFFSDNAPDERLTFDWANRTASFETTTTCQPALAVSSELGGTPAVTWQWTMMNGQVTSITDGTRTLTPKYTNATPAFAGHRLEEAGGVLEELTLISPRQTCEPASLSAERVISGQQAYTFAGYDPQPAAFTGLNLDFDLRNGHERLLSYGFLDPGLAAPMHVTNSNGFRWQLFYAPVTGSNYVTDQPNLIAEALLTGYSGSTCGTNVSNKPTSSLYAAVHYQYLSLADYLTQYLQ